MARVNIFLFLFSFVSHLNWKLWKFTKKIITTYDFHPVDDKTSGKKYSVTDEETKLVQEGCVCVCVRRESEKKSFENRQVFCSHIPSLR